MVGLPPRTAFAYLVAGRNPQHRSRYEANPRSVTRSLEQASISTCYLIVYVHEPSLTSAEQAT